MAVYLIGNQAERDANSIYVSDAATTNDTVTDAVNVARGGRHLKVKTNVADRGIIYRNNSANLDADCCVIAGASRMLGHRMHVRSFSDCNGFFNGGTSNAEHVWDGDDFGRGLARDFISANTEELTILDADQTGLDLTTDFWFGGWFLLDATASSQAIFSKIGATTSYLLFWNTSNMRWQVSYNGTATSQANETTIGAISAGTWYFFFVYHDNGTNIGVALNGNAFQTAAHTTGVFNSTEPFRLARGPYMDGGLSHICCGTNIDLGPRAIASWLYNGGSGRTWYDWSDAMKTKTGLVSHWSLKESSGDAIDDYGPNDLTDTNTCGSRIGPFTYPEAIEERYSSTSVMVGPPDRTKKPQDLVHFFSSGKTSQEGFGTFFGAGDGGAYTEEVPAMYFDTAFELPNPEWPVVEQPAYASVKKGRQYLKVERATTLRVPFLTRSQVEQLKGMDLDEPIFVYDSDGKHLHDKLWHCICTISDVAQFDDQYTVTLSLQRLRHYEVV